jgi:hypothetical protein
MTAVYPGRTVKTPMRHRIDAEKRRFQALLASLERRISQHALEVARLRTEFPAVFDPYHEADRARCADDLRRATGMPWRQVRIVLAWWTRTPAYRRALAADGSMRHALHDRPTSSA